MDLKEPEARLEYKLTLKQGGLSLPLPRFSEFCPASQNKNVWPEQDIFHIIFFHSPIADGGFQLPFFISDTVCLKAEVTGRPVANCIRPNRLFLLSQ